MRFGVAMVAVSGLLGASCVCARLPDAPFPCAVDSDCLTGACVEGICRGSPSDAGPTDGGAKDAGPSDAGPIDAGVDAGADAGVFDAGAPLYCNDWACASSGFVPWDGGLSFDVEHCAAYDGGGIGWFGAVLVPSGDVIGIPFGATRVLRVEPKTLACELIGPELAAPPGSWFSGVLGPDGFVYAAPHNARRMLRIDPRPGGQIAEWGPDLSVFGAAPLFQGSAVDRAGSVWMVSQTYATTRVDLDGGMWRWPGPDAGAGVASCWGLARVEPSADALLVTVPVVVDPSNRIGVIDPRRLLVLPSGEDDFQGTVPLRGVSPRFDGSLITVSYGSVPTFMGQLHVRADAGVSATLYDAGSLQPGFTTTGPDGEVWSMPANGDSVLRWLPGAPTAHPVGYSFSGFSSCGVVATPSGLIGLPCEQSPAVIRLRLSSPEARTMEQLMSPFFNRL